MAISIDTAYIETYESRVRQLAQQGKSLLRNCVTEVHNNSKSHHFDRLAASSVRSKTSSHITSPAGGSGSGAIGTTDGLTWTRRNTLIATKDWGEIIAQEQTNQMLIDPNSAVALNGAMAMKRAVDDVIVAGANDDALDGAGGTVAFPSGQIVGSATQLLNDIDVLHQVNEIFASNDIDPDEEKFLIIGPTQQRALLNVDEVINGDYMTVKMLMSGYVENCFGFNKIIVSNRLGNHASPPTAGQIYCLAFTRRAIGLHVAGDITAEVAPRPDMSFETQVYLRMDMDATRVEDEHIVRLWLKDALT